MKIAYVVFDDITLLDFIGIYDPITRLKAMKYLPDLTWDICAFSSSIQDGFGLEISTKKPASLEDYDAIIVSGGYGTRTLMKDQAFMSWLKTAKGVPYKISICTGSLLLGAAGFLNDKKATTHFDAYELLKPFCKEVVKERIVEDGQIITAGAVASSIDLGLFLCKKWAGKEAAKQIRFKMDYHG